MRRPAGFGLRMRRHRARLLLFALLLAPGCAPPPSPAARSRQPAAASVAAASAATAPDALPSEVASAPRIKLAFGGDVMLARLVSVTLGARGPRYVWGDALPLLLAPDLTLVNLECVIARNGERFEPRRVFYFRAVPAAISALTLADIDYVSLANNHALDYRAPALLETLRRLDQVGILHAGAGRNQSEAEAHAMLEARGVKVGVVAFADHFDLYAATSQRPGTNVIDIDPDGPDFERVKRALGRVRNAGADVVVFSIHWGPNMRPAPTAQFVDFAHAVLDAGADIFHGHSAHIFQGIELYRGKPILFDTGDLVDDYAVDETLRNDQQLLFLVEGRGTAGWRVELVPLVIGDMQVNLARGRDFDEIGRRMRRLCGRFGTQILRQGDRLLARPAPE